MEVDGSVLRKLWFQLGVGILLLLLIIILFLEVKWLFNPIIIIARTIFIPLLISGVIYYITVPLQVLLERFKVPRWGSIGIIFLTIAIVIFIAVLIVGPPITLEVNNLIENGPAIIQSTNVFP